MPYTCNIRANLMKEELMEGLKESHCVTVYWSIESGNDFFRNKVLKRKMTKEQILETAHLLNKYEIRHRNGGMLGLPGEKYENMLETLEINIATKPFFGFASIFIPFPGLELTEYAKRTNHLVSDSLVDLPKNTHLRSALDFTHEENLRIQKLTYLYPFFVSYPNLYYNKTIQKQLFRLHKTVLYLLFNLFSGYKLSKLYTAKLGLKLKLAVLWRYLRYPF